MALPSRRRPAEVEQILKQNTPESTTTKLRLNLKKIFMDSMVIWYDNLADRMKKRLTNKRIIKRAIVVAYNLRLPYENLPENWLRILHDEHGFRFKFSVPRVLNTRNRIGVETKWRMEDDYEAQSPPRKRTKFNDEELIDLTNEPPPREWIEMYHSKKAITPRQLKVHKTRDNRLVVYYDYSVDNVKPQDEHKKCNLTQAYRQDGVYETHFC